MTFRKVTPFLLFLVLCLLACQEGKVGNRGDMTMANFAATRNPAWASDSLRIRTQLARLIQADADSFSVDHIARQYYLSGKPLIWIDRPNVYPQMTDTLRKIFAEVRSVGFSPKSFLAEAIADDLQHLDSLQLDSAHYQIDRLLARLEYYLTKGYLRMVAGERYGYVNPTKIFNRLDRDDNYPDKIVFRRLFDIDIEHPDSAFYAEALRVAGTAEMLPFIDASRPRSAFFQSLVQQLDTVRDEASRTRLICNMERCRWRLLDQPEDHPKRVVVNVPAFRVYSFDSDTAFSMKMACGAVGTKTPLLTSQVNRMEMNPLWIIPRSIIEKEVVAHVDDSAYFIRNRYFVRNKQTGDTIPPQELTVDILKSTNYMVAQERGAGNSLGRIIFRFPNDFAVYLHDTNSPKVFSRNNRAVSHGCVRLERPLDMALFLLDGKDSDTIEKIRYSTSVSLTDPSEIDKSKFVSYLSLKKEVPIFITYYTIFPDEDGSLQAYSDVYGYDRVIAQQLKKYME